MLDAFDEDDDQVVEQEESKAQEEDELKKKYINKAKKRKRKLALGLAAVGGTMGIVASGGILGVVGLVGGGLAGAAIGKKGEKAAKKKAVNCKFEPVGKQTKE